MTYTFILDLDGVVIKKTEPWYVDLQTEMGISPQDLQDEFFNPHWDDVVTGRKELRETLAGVLTDIAPALDAGMLIDYWFRRSCSLNSRLISQVQDLKSQGFVFHCATNQEHCRAQYLWTDMGLKDVFARMHYSASLGYKKPSFDFFNSITTNTGMNPDDVCFVDDRVENVRAAKQAGWKAEKWNESLSLSRLARKYRWSPSSSLSEGARNG